MSAVTTALKRLLGRDPPVVVRECRHCGTSVPGGDGECPSCGAAAIARYEIG